MEVFVLVRSDPFQRDPRLSNQLIMRQFVLITDGQPEQNMQQSTPGSEPLTEHGQRKQENLGTVGEPGGEIKQNFNRNRFTPAWFCWPSLGQGFQNHSENTESLVAMVTAAYKEQNQEASEPQVQFLQNPSVEMGVSLGSDWSETSSSSRQNQL